MKNIGLIIITLCVIFGANWGIASMFDAEWIEFSFLIGLVFVVIIWFFTSSGGYTTNLVRMSVQSQTGMKMEEEKKQFTPSIVFYTAVGYLVISVIVTIYYYKDYFISS
ncbi:MAG: hypothetical protein ACQEWU_13900 [Bacillota bacterium]|uniref:Uncharacterized protein n=1 Tax=Virgibacillus salarius TaxID=447199 RepID=A0A941E161_9BACI|nr:MULTISPECIES: hypothetical protein [Virgibacillus]MBR7797848.1 hypothetical protein [Virgibacillus salarius]MDY7045271.1 hypothetical protein [Virgibacillus sp. M23]NAZ10558.1 hypothetical protein [Agaribacter marinus]WBX79040.1 hypothetical protein PD280_14700 [Virgibacillus salarius]